MSLAISGDSPNFTNATLTTPTLTSPTFAGTPTGSIITSGTAVASTSGTSIDFTGIPSWVKRITVMLNNVSTNGTSAYLIQIGSGSFVTTGYTSQAWSATASTGVLANGLVLSNTLQSNLEVWTGICTLNLFSSNTWVYTGMLSYAIGTSTGYFSGGNSPSLSGALDRIRITTVAGTATFDAGSINILYE